MFKNNWTFSKSYCHFFLFYRNIWKKNGLNSNYRIALLYEQQRIIQVMVLSVIQNVWQYKLITLSFYKLLKKEKFKSFDKRRKDWNYVCFNFFIIIKRKPFLYLSWIPNVFKKNRKQKYQNVLFYPFVSS